MPDVPLLPFYPNLEDAVSGATYIDAFKRLSSHVSESSLDHLMYSAFVKRHLPSRAVSYSSNHDAMVRAREFYGAGYKDAALRYRQLEDNLTLKIAYGKINDLGNVHTIFVHTRGTVMFFAAFMVLLVSSVCVAIISFQPGMKSLAQVGLPGLCGSMVCGLIWLRRAEVERQRFRALRATH